MIETLVASLAEALINLVIDDIAHRPGLIILRDKLRGNSPEKLALQRALLSAYSHFSIQYPHLTAAFFDEFYLSKNEVVTELSKLLTPNLHPNLEVLASIWKKQYSANPQIAVEDDLGVFLQYLRDEIKAQTQLKPFVDSRAFQELYVIAERTGTQVEILSQIREDIRNLLNQISPRIETGTASVDAIIRENEISHPSEEINTVANMTSKRVFISYRHTQPDEEIAKALYSSLTGEYSVFMDIDIAVGVDWAARIRREIEECDVFIALLSKTAVQSEMVIEEINIAHHSHKQRGLPQILPVRLAFREPLSYMLGAYLNSIQWAFWESVQDTPRLIRVLREAIGTSSNLPTTTFVPDLSAPESLPPPMPAAELETPGGTMKPQSEFYIERRCDEVALTLGSVCKL